MTIRSNVTAVSLTGSLGSIPEKTPVSVSKFQAEPLVCSRSLDFFSWDQLRFRFPLVHLLQPDYYRVFKFGNPEPSVHQQNLHLDLGPLEINNRTIQQYLDPGDLSHMHRTDRIIQRFAEECRLGAFDFICGMVIRWNGPHDDHRYLLRKLTVLLADSKGLPAFGISTLKDITSLVSSSKPNTIDLTFQPERSELRAEIMRRINKATPKRKGSITSRELEVIRCISKGMSSKEIAAALYISKATVDTHRQNLIHKWEVTNTAALLRRAMEEGCI